MNSPQHRVSSTQPSKDSGIQVISRAADILRLLGSETDGKSLGEIATAVSLPRSTVQRIVAALALEGFVTADKGEHGVRLGPQIQSLARVSAGNFKDRWRPLMKDIGAKTGETVDLAILDGNRMRFVDQIVGGHRLRTVSSIGTTFPLTTTANGKAALACLDHADALALVKAEIEQSLNDEESALTACETGSDQNIEKRISDALAAIARIRAGELSQDVDEHTEGISALGFAVRDVNDDIYALSVPVPSSRFDSNREQLHIVIEAARNALEAGHTG